MNTKRLSLMLLACAALAACGNEDIKDTLGLTRKAPDEFQVYSRPPLNVPPEFELRPPAKGSDTYTGLPAQDIARSKVLSTAQPEPSSAPAPLPQSHFLNGASAAPAAVSPVTSAALPTASDAQFLSDAGAAKADPHVRDAIDQDKAKGPVKTGPYLFGNKQDGDPEVDAAKEAERLKQDKAQDKPPTAGDTPVVAPKDTGILGTIF